MNYYEYPVDSISLLAKKKRIKREAMMVIKEPIKKRIAVLGGSTTSEIVDQISIYLLQFGIVAEFYQSEFGKYWEDAVWGNEKLEQFNPDLIVIHTTWRNVQGFPNVGESKEAIEKRIISEYTRFEVMWKQLKQKYNCPIIQNNFDRPNYRLLGNRDVWDIQGRTFFINRLNDMLYSYAQTHDGFYINDIDYISASVGLDNWNDEKSWAQYKYAMSITTIPAFASNIGAIIKAIFGKNKKVLVLDLDNTLWGGVIGDDGIEGISIGPEVPDGEAYATFQQYCKQLKKIGVVLAVNSKNDVENALLGLSHPDSVLNKDDFIVIKANWNPKNQNMIEIASEINVGMDSMVFVDDNPAEQELIRNQCPDISVIKATRVEDFIKYIDHNNFFESVSLSPEDMKKTELYIANTKRKNEEARYATYEEYLESLEMVASIDSFSPMYVQRIAQLTNKSNQFNLTTMRCTEEDIRSMMLSQDWITLSGRLRDKFGDNGLVSVVSGQVQDKSLHIRLWLMSCRVLKRNLEHEMMNTLVERCKKQGISEVIGYYYPTAKNGMVKDFYRNFNFDLIEEQDNKMIWKLDVCKYEEKCTHILIKEE